MKVTFLISLFIITNLFAVKSHCQNISELPGLFIERKIDSTKTIIPGLKARYQQCVKLKIQNMELHQKHPSFWQIASKSVSSEYVKNITVIPKAEPLWLDEMVGYKREQEYFLKNQYVLVSEDFTYRLVEDGLCMLVKTKKERRLIDNGEYVFRVNRETAPRHLDPLEPHDDPWMDEVSFVKYNSTKKQSATISGPKANKQFGKTLSSTEGLSKRLAAIAQFNKNEMKHSENASKTKTRVNTPPKNDIIHAIKSAFELHETKSSRGTHIIKANTDHSAAGQACDLVTSQNLKSTICYWSIAHNYPSFFERPIILKKEYRGVIESAVLFDFISNIPDGLMTPPAKP